MRIGAHVSVGKGWVAAVDYCASIGAECLQVFSKSPRMWRAARLPAEARSPFSEARAKRDIGPVFAHTSYLINLGSDDDELWERSIDALAEEFRRAGAVDAAGLVTHVGTDPWDDRLRAAERIVDGIAKARERTDDAGRATELLVENSAGSGRQYGGDLGDLGVVVRLSRERERELGPIGICFDTCHAFAQGYPLDDATEWGAALDELESVGAGDSVRLIHANDCLFERGEHRDRHAWIGDGNIGRDAFRTMFALPALAGCPVIVEMPGEPPEKDEVNLERLKLLRTEAGAG